MNVLTEEIKTRARVLQKQLQRQHSASIKRVRILCRRRNWSPETEPSHSQCLNLIAADTGFRDWEHARCALSGQATDPGDMGEFWYGEHAAGFTNLWFSGYAEARHQHALQPGMFLLPYARQFVLAEASFVKHLGMTDDDAVWSAIQYDLVAAYGSQVWQTLAQQRLQQTRLEHWESQWNWQADQQALHSDEQTSAQILKNFVADERIQKIPQQRKKRLVILRWLAAQISMEIPYSEIALNQVLSRYHDDVATLRRELVVHGLMQRENGIYRKLR